MSPSVQRLVRFFPAVAGTKSHAVDVQSTAARCGAGEVDLAGDALMPLIAEQVDRLDSRICRHCLVYAYDPDRAVEGLR